MITYWPNQQSMHLNIAVANLFVQTYQKFTYPLTNTTKNSLPIDLFNITTKKQLLTEILIEIEILILDLTEINLDIVSIKKLEKKILYDLINKIIYNFFNKLTLTTQIPLIKSNSVHTQYFFYEHNNLISQVLLYLIFGASVINKEIFPFYYLTTPFNHVRLLFENTILQLSNFIVLNILEQQNSITSLSTFLINNNLCPTKYKSIRAIANFRNNLTTYYWINEYIDYPQNIYRCSYKIWLFSSKGLIYKYIYFNRITEYAELSRTQLLSILYLEMQDFIIPKINQLIILIGQLILYITGEIINKGFKICSRAIIYKINQNQ